MATLITSHDHVISHEEFGYQNHHYVSHHENRKDYLDVISKVDRLDVEQFS